MSDAEITELAEHLSLVFFGPPTSAPPVASFELVDRAVSGGLEVLEANLDRIHHRVAAAAVELVVRLRSGRLDRMSCRVLAASVRDAIEDDVGLDGRVAPLGILLCALSIVADGPERDDRALDPNPDPSRPVEVALAAVLADPERRAPLRAALRAGPLFVPVLDVRVDGSSLALRFLPIVVRGVPTVGVFTSPERVSDHALVAGVGDVPLMEMSGSELASVCPRDHGVTLNAGAVLGCTLQAAQISALGNPSTSPWRP